MNEFSTTQLGVIRELAGCYWDNNQRINVYGEVTDEETLAYIKGNYIEAIINGLKHQEVWP